MSASIVQYVSVYKNFCNYFEENVEEMGCAALDIFQIESIWDEFCSRLQHRAEFEYSFKFIYMCLRTIKEADLNPEDKKAYINIVTDLINYEQLFCYFINQMAFSKANPDDETVKTLRESNFFRDLFTSPIFNRVKERFPQDVINCISPQ